MDRALLTFCLALALCQGAGATGNDPRANHRACVIQGKSRITVLTPRLVRIEWAEDGVFENRATLTVVNRRLPVPRFSVERTGATVAITSDAIRLVCTPGELPFDSTNLRVRFRTGSMEGEWHPGKAPVGNLRGTARTLDGFDGEVSARDSSRLQLEQGIISTDGWSVIDDSERPLLDGSPRPWVVARPQKRAQDLYLLAYGKDYRAALRDFVAVAGRIPLPPRFAFGYWYSRWRASSEMELRELVETFASLDIPLDVLVVDMDWHITALPEFFDGEKRRKDQAGEDCGWTGFTWNRSMFPDPAGFLAWTERKGLRTCLNLHPASGIQPHEAQYPAMARAMGIDPATRSYVPFNIVDSAFARKYFDIVLHPMEDEGVDFWWLDWQQWNTTAVKGVNPTFFLNYLHFTDMERRGARRPLIYHRWGGLGNHRYQIGFSGDARISWASLDFQPYFTATAANVGFGYWGHDVGGFAGEPNTPEQFTRWFQFGVFSPILKTHATGRNFRILRKIWEYPPETFLQLRSLIHLRYALIPYLYTAARGAYDTGVSPCHPLYYEHPGRGEAYSFRNEYFFGADMIVHPVTRPLGRDSLFVLQRSWLPPGEWFEWCSGTRLRGDTIVARPYTLHDIPFFVRSGAIVPMQPPMRSTGERPVDPLILVVFPGAAGRARVYEDQGNDSEYRRGGFAFTPVQMERRGRRLRLTIGPAEGSYRGMPGKRSYEIRMPHTLPPETVDVDGTRIGRSAGKVSGNWTYDGPELTTIVRVTSRSVRAGVTLEISFPGEEGHLLEGRKRQMQVLYRFSKFLSDQRNFRRQDVWSDGRFPSDLVMRAAQTGLRITARPDSAAALIREFDLSFAATTEMLRRLAAEKPLYAPHELLMQALR